MSPEASNVLTSALAQTPAERKALIASLAVSLDVGSEDAHAVSQAWDDEFGRRCRDIDEGRVKLVPWTEVRSR